MHLGAKLVMAQSGNGGKFILIKPFGGA